jgi:hypothetical protein
MGATLASHTGGPRRQRGRANGLPLSRRNGGGPYNGTLSLSLCFTSVMEKNYRHYERELRSNDPHNMLQLQWPLLIRSIHSIFLGCVPEYFGIFYVVPYLERMRIRLWFFFGFSACSWKLQSRTERAQVPDGLRAAAGRGRRAGELPVPAARRWCESHTGPGGSTSMKCWVRLATNLSEKQRQGRTTERGSAVQVKNAHHIISFLTWGLCTASHACSDRSRGQEPGGRSSITTFFQLTLLRNIALSWPYVRSLHLIKATGDSAVCGS